MAVVVALIIGAATYFAISKRNKSTDSVSAEAIKQDETTTSTSSTSTTTTQPPTTIAATCPSDDPSLKTAIVSAGAMNSTTMSHMGITSGSKKYAIGTKYIFFSLAPIDAYGSQGGGIFMRCDAGAWKFLTFVDGLSCNQAWTGDDRTAAVTFRIC